METECHLFSWPHKIGLSTSIYTLSYSLYFFFFHNTHENLKFFLCVTFFKPVCSLLECQFQKGRLEALLDGVIVLCIFITGGYCSSDFKGNYFLTSGEGNGSPLQYSCLANPMDRGAW